MSQKLLDIGNFDFSFPLHFKTLKILEENEIYPMRLILAKREVANIFNQPTSITLSHSCFHFLSMEEIRELSMKDKVLKNELEAAKLAGDLDFFFAVDRDEIDEAMKAQSNDFLGITPLKYLLIHGTKEMVEKLKWRFNIEDINEFKEFNYLDDEKLGRAIFYMYNKKDEILKFIDPERIEILNQIINGFGLPSTKISIFPSECDEESLKNRIIINAFNNDDAIALGQLLTPDKVKYLPPNPYARYQSIPKKNVKRSCNRPCF